MSYSENLHSIETLNNLAQKNKTALLGNILRKMVLVSDSVTKELI